MDFIPAGVQPYLSLLFSSLHLPQPLLSAIITLRALLLPLITRLTTNPDIASVALLAIILWISLKILGMLYNAVMFWVRLAMRVAFWGSVILGSIYVYNRGLEGTIEDISKAYGVWMGEYDYWKAQQEQAMRFGGKSQKGGGRNAWK